MKGDAAEEPKTRLKKNLQDFLKGKARKRNH